MTIIFTQNDNLGLFWVKIGSCHLVNLPSFASSSFFLSMWKITWLNFQQPKTRGHVEDHYHFTIAFYFSNVLFKSWPWHWFWVYLPFHFSTNLHKNAKDYQIYPLLFQQCVIWNLGRSTDFGPICLIHFGVHSVPAMLLEQSPVSLVPWQGRRSSKRQVLILSMRSSYP